MKKLAILLTGLQIIWVAGQAQEAKTNAPVRIAAGDAKQHLNAEAIVTGKVAEVYSTDKLVRVNLDKPYPDQPFTAVIFANSTNLFSGLDKLKGKQIEVSGKIVEFRGRAEIVLSNAAQLKVLDHSAEAEKK